MTRSPAADVERALDAFPRALRDLLEAEKAAGNAVTGIGDGFPAPPRGGWARLARPVTTRPRQSGAGLVFRSRNWHAQGFEWSDDEGYFFLLEPPLPAPGQQSMDEIRAAQAVGAGQPLPAPPVLPLPAAGEYRVDVDYRGEMVTYCEAGRTANVSCTWGPHPIIRRSSLAGWQRPGAKGAPMNAEERQIVLDRVVEHLRRLGMEEVDFED